VVVAGTRRLIKRLPQDHYLGSRIGGGTYGGIPAYVGVGAFVVAYVGAYVDGRMRLPT
jgi:hypothetical protein